LDKNSETDNRNRLKGVQLDKSQIFVISLSRFIQVINVKS